MSNAEYAAFLNAIAKTDTYGLYDVSMIRIQRTGSSGTYAYAPQAGTGSEPVNAVTFYHALRFANWLHNGQPDGPQDATTTEDGAYTFSGATSVGARNPDALFALPSEDEWYKAAYHDPVSATYLAWPTGSTAPSTCAAPTATPDRANCDVQAGYLTDRGSYPGSASPYGTFDQGGNVWEWNEAEIDGGTGWHRGLRGGAYHVPSSLLAATARLSADPASPPEDVNAVGLRVVCLPEPGGTAPLLAAAALLLALSRGRRAVDRSSGAA